MFFLVVRLLTLAILVGSLIQPTGAGEITRCTGAIGMGYYFPGGAISAAEAGWQKDGFDDGVFKLLEDAIGFDIIFKDATGDINSARAAGGTVIRYTGQNPGFVNIFITYQTTGVIENYMFKLDTKGNGPVVFVATKPVSFVGKAGMYSAWCESGR